jgi:hypothetical protein
MNGNFSFFGRISGASRRKPGYPLVSFARYTGQKDTAPIPCAHQNREAVLVRPNGEAIWPWEFCSALGFLVPPQGGVMYFFQRQNSPKSGMR